MGSTVGILRYWKRAFRVPAAVDEMIPEKAKMRDIVVVSNPSSLAVWGFQFLEGALRLIFPALVTRRVDRHDSVDDLDASATPRLFLSAFPPPVLAADCERLNKAPIVLLDELLPSVAYVRAGGTVSTLEAVRAQSASLTLCGACRAVTGARLVRRQDELRLVDLLTMAVRATGATIAPEALEAACLPFGGAMKQCRDMVAEWEARADLPLLTEEDEQLAQSVLGGLYALVENGVVEAMAWPGRSFLLGDRPGTPAPVVSEVTGRARIIFYGPYFHLPRGRWNLRISLGFSHDIRGLPFSIQIASTEPLGEVRILAERAGIFAVNSEIVVTTPHEPIEIRTMSEQGAIEGHIALASVELTYLADN